jgi:DNA-binding CsgD family transcriptional regulator
MQGLPDAGPRFPAIALADREQSLADLDQWLSAADRGGAIVLMSGEAGIGRTSLLREFWRRHPERRRLWGDCDPLFTPRPLAPLHDVARQGQGSLSRALAAGADRDVIFNAALDELERGAPSLVVFDDLQWADEGTLDLLKFLGRRIHRTRSLLVVSYRDDELGARHPLRSVLGDLPRSCTRRMTLAPLSAATVAELARRAGRSPSDVYAATGGNPFLVTEVLTAPADSVPVAVRDAVLARAARLDQAAREIAELVAILPGKTERSLLMGTLKPEEATLDRALAIGMVRDADGALSFRHELCRRAMEESLSPSRKRSVHEQLLARLTSDERARFNEKLSLEYQRTGDQPRAIEARQVALDIWRSSGARVREGDTLRVLSELVWHTGQHALAGQHAAEAVTILEALPPGPELAIAAANLVQLELMTCGRADRSDLERSLQGALASGYFEQAARAYAALIAAAMSSRCYADARRYLTEALMYCHEHGLERWRLNMLAASARWKFEQGEWAASREDAEAVVQSRRATRDARRTALVVLAHLRIRRGGDDGPETLLAEAQALQVSAEAVNAARTEAAWLADGALAVAQPNWIETGVNWRARASAWKEMGCPYEHALLLGVNGCEAEKRAGLAILERLGATPATQLVRRQLRAAGAKRVPRGPQTWTQSHPQGLTRRQAEVLRLLVEGLRNSEIASRMFISRKTVDHHVSAVLMKLGVSTRAEVIARARRHSGAC